MYRAHDPRLGRIVALKVLHPDRAGDSEAEERLRREARSAGRLAHPGIVAIHEVGEADGRTYLVSAYIPGAMLERLLTGDLLRPAKAASLVAQVADALDHAHRNGVIHRDLKPSNILLDALARPMLTDFGLARSDTGEALLTLAGQVVGTPSYMAPEQAQEGSRQVVDERTDVYGLGAVLYALLTGVPPFRGPNRIVVQQVLDLDPRPVRCLNKAIPRDLETIVLKAMAKDPRQR